VRKLRACLFATMLAGSLLACHHSQPETHVFGYEPVLRVRGASAVGPVFAVPYDDGYSELIRVWEVERDPLAVWDDYVDALSVFGARLTYSIGACAVEFVESNMVTGYELSAKATRLPPPNSRLTCQAGGRGQVNGKSFGVSVWLGWGQLMTSRSDRVMVVQVQPGAAPGIERVRGTKAPSGTPVPRLNEKRPVGPGDYFGRANNAFEDQQYQRFRLEPKMTLEGQASGRLLGWDFVAVLRVDDAHRALQEFARQLAAGRTRPPPIKARRVLGVGVLQVENLVEAGGGARITSDPSGQWLVLWTESD
jgi:hypothetical protein